MKSILPSLVFAMAVITIYPADLVADDFADANRAHRDGDYQKTLDLFIPLAFRGDSRA